MIRLLTDNTVSLSAISFTSFQGRVEGVAQAVAEKVEGDHHQAHDDGREDDQVGVDAQILLVGGHHDAEGLLALETQVQVGQGGLGENGGGDHEHAAGDDRAHGVGQDVLEDEAHVG